MKALLQALWAMLLCASAWAGPSPAEVDARTHRLASELRCLVCQNQTLADSTAPLAQDLKQQVRELVAAGRSDDEVLAHLTARYGDFVRYKPPLKASTALLWGGPALLFAAALGGLAWVLRQRSRLAPQDFDPEPADDHA